MRSLAMKALLRTIGFFLWTSFSAWLFVQVEYTGEDDVNDKYQSLHSLYESMESKYNMTIKDFNNFSNVAHDALSAPKLQWTYSTSFDFVFQTVTTVGYGYITPGTSEGQILCIFIALVGIPLTMLALKTIGELIVNGVNTIVKKFERKILKRPEPKLVQTKSAVILFSLMVILVLILGLFLARIRADFTVVESVYFLFVSFTTIGFGDYVAKHMPQSIQQLSNNSSRNQTHNGKSAVSTVRIFIVIFYLLSCMLGFCLVSSVLNSIMAAIEERNCRPRCPGCVPRRIRVDVGNDKNNSADQCNTDMTYSSMNNAGFRKENDFSLSVTEIQ